MPPSYQGTELWQHVAVQHTPSPPHQRNVLQQPLAHSVVNRSKDLLDTRTTAGIPAIPLATGKSGIQGGREYICLRGQVVNSYSRFPYVRDSHLFSGSFQCCCYQWRCSGLDGQLLLLLHLLVNPFLYLLYFCIQALSFLRQQGMVTAKLETAFQPTLKNCEDLPGKQRAAVLNAWVKALRSLGVFSPWKKKVFVLHFWANDRKLFSLRWK